jgi:hypothetical protein
MAKVRRAQDIYVRVELPERIWRGKADQFGYVRESEVPGLDADADALVREIRRTVMDVGIVRVEIDTVPICEFCGETWREDPFGKPSCCDDGVQDWAAGQDPEPMSEPVEGDTATGGTVDRMTPRDRQDCRDAGRI